MIKVRAIGAAAFLLILPLSGAARALDPEAAAKAFLSPGETGDTKSVVTWDSAAMDGSDVVITGAKVSVSADGTTAGSNTVSRIRLVNVTETGNGHFTASSAVYTDMRSTIENNVSVVVPEINMTGLRTRDASGDKLPLPVTYESATAANITIDAPAENVKVTIAEANMTMADFNGDLPTSGTLNITGIDVPLSAFPPGPTSPAALGYEKNLVFNVVASGKVRPETSGFALEDLTFSGADVGTLSLSLDMDNYPNLANVEETNPMEMMGVTLISVSIKYVDDTFAVRVLDMMAQAQGMQRAEYAQQMSAALPFMLMAINNQAFQDKVATAAGSFLANPGTIEIRANPAKPMTAAEIMGIAQSAPQTLPDALNVSVEAK